MKQYQAIIIGAGFGGICQAIKLKEAGIEDFIILEKADGVGGTWRINTYPGAACDVPSVWYSFSFEQKKDWKHKWSHQDQILDYIKHCIKKYELGKHLVFQQKLNRATYKDKDGTWTLLTQNDTFCCASLIVAVGQLHQVNLPHFKGLENYTGKYWHSAHWNHDLDLEGKKIAVVGNAASAVQFVPELAKVAKHVTIFQRSANWLLPKKEPKATAWRDFLWALPGSVWLRKLSLNIQAGFVYRILRQHPVAQKLGAFYSQSFLRWQVKDPELREKLTPNYPIGAKRILFSHNYYPSLTKPNVQLETRPIDRFSANGILLEGEAEIEADAVVFATGFITNPFLRNIVVEGAQGQLLSEAWKDGAEAFLGISVADFPNFYLMFGPNTNLGHQSIIFMLECQAKYITQCLVEKQQKQVKSLVVKKEKQVVYNKEIQKRLESSVWNRLDKSWYRIANKITNNWPGTIREFAKRTRKVNFEHYDKF